ncbi:MAG: tetraacyldisaccharide 4'-kinase [Candidatus Kryptoniota bacterium]
MGNRIKNILLPFSALYGGAVSVRNLCYDNHLFRMQNLPRPVISVGNISVGGSGKTPFVMYLVEKLLALAKKPAVLSRGYKRMTDELIISYPEKGAEPDIRFLGDEPALISQNLPNVPVAVQKDRHHAGLVVLEKFGADVFILDDGLQNRELHRDVDFVLLRNSLQDLRDKYLPAGNLRDSPKRIRQADIIILTSHNNGNFSDFSPIKNYSNAPIAEVSFIPSDFLDHTGQSHSLEMMAGMEVAAFCGIANPGQFFSGIESLNIKIVRRKLFHDHHWFDEYDIDEVFGGNEDIIALTTLKDAVRIFRDEELRQKEEVKRIYALRERAVVNFGEEHIDNVLTKVFGEVYA